MACLASLTFRRKKERIKSRLIDVVARSVTVGPIRSAGHQLIALQFIIILAGYSLRGKSLVCVMFL